MPIMEIKFVCRGSRKATVAKTLFVGKALWLSLVHGSYVKQALPSCSLHALLFYTGVICEHTLTDIHEVLIFRLY